MDHTRDVKQRVCTNGHDIDEYPEQFHQGTRIGVNFRGFVEYANVEKNVVYELVYMVSNPVYDDIRQHDMLGDAIDEHIEASEDRFGEWRFVEGV